MSQGSIPVVPLSSEIKEVKLDIASGGGSAGTGSTLYSNRGTAEDVDNALTTLPETWPFEIDPRPPSCASTVRFDFWRGPTFVWACLAGFLHFVLCCFCCRKTVEIISDREMADLFRWSWPYSRLLEPVVSKQAVESTERGGYHEQKHPSQLVSSSSSSRSSQPPPLVPDLWVLDTCIMNQVKGFSDTCLQGGRCYFRASDCTPLYMEFPLPSSAAAATAGAAPSASMSMSGSNSVRPAPSAVSVKILEDRLSHLKEPIPPSAPAKADSKRSAAAAKTRQPRLVRASSSSGGGDSQGSSDEDDQGGAPSRSNKWIRLDAPIPGISSPRHTRRWEHAKLFFMSGAHHQIKFAAHAACHFPRQTLVDLTKIVFEPHDLVWRALEPHWEFSENINDNVLISPGSVLNARATTRSCFDTQTMPRAEIQKLLDWGARRFVLPMGTLPDPRFRGIHAVLVEWGTVIGRCYLGETVMVAPKELAARRTKMRDWCRSLNKHLPATFAIAEDDMIRPSTFANVFADYVLAVSVQHSMDHDGLYRVSIRKQPMLIRQPLLTRQGEFADSWQGDSCCSTHSVVSSYDAFKHTIYASVFVRWLNCCCGLSTSCCCCMGCCSCLFGTCFGCCFDACKRQKQDYPSCCASDQDQQQGGGGSGAAASAESACCYATSCCDGRLTETRYDFRDVAQLRALQPLFRQKLRRAIDRLAIPGLGDRIARSVQW